MARSFRPKLRIDPALMAGGVLILIAGIAVGAPLVAPHDPLSQDISIRLKPPYWFPNGSTDYLLGTDQLGRDILSRLIFGARVSLFVGLTAVVMAAILGTTAGIIAGYRGGIIDEALMRLAEVRLTIPFILLLITVLAIFGPGLRNVILLLALSEWVIYARVVRAETLSVREREFVEAARALGATPTRIMVRHILPNVSSLAIAVAAVEVGTMILLESTLGFLGLGVPPPTPTWGNMLGEGRTYLTSAWWLATFPGLALTVTVISISIAGEGIRDWLDPRSETQNMGAIEAHQ